MKANALKNIALFSTILAFVVVVLGAYVRLSDAGLGCPDWPLCYGSFVVPQSESAIEAANLAYPERLVEVDKAWKETIHRYAASVLGLLVLIMTFIAIRKAMRSESTQLGHCIFLLLLVCAQGALGAFTVTMLVPPPIVTAHLFGGLATLALLWLLYLRNAPWFKRDATPSARSLRPLIGFGFMVLVVQIFLGGWTSTNYAALSCPDLPTCQGQIWPDADFANGFVLWRGIGPDYEGGRLDNASRVAIHLAHRLGAIVTALALIAVCAALLSKPVAKSTRRLGYLLLLGLLLQLGLGLGNVLFSLPIEVATAHNGGAAFLVLLMISLLYKTSYRRTDPLIPATKS